MQVFPSDSCGITTDVFQWSEVSGAAHPDSKSSIHDFKVPADNLPLRQIPFPSMAIKIFNYLSSVIGQPQQT